MKIVILFTLCFSLLSVQNASAEIIKNDCRFNDHQALNQSLTNNEIRQGAEFKNEVLDLLSQEMGPICNTVFDTDLTIGIPGNKVQKYELIGADVAYEISLTRSMEENAAYVIISKK